MHDEYLFTSLSEHFACIRYSQLGSSALGSGICVLLDVFVLENSKYWSYTGILNLSVNGKASRIRSIAKHK